MTDETKKERLLTGALRDLYHATIGATARARRGPHLASALKEASVVLRRSPLGIDPGVAELAPLISSLDDMEEARAAVAGVDLIESPED